MSRLIAMPCDRDVLDAALRQDFGTFVVKVFHTVSPDRTYLHNWHIDAVVHRLMLVYAGENRRLIITQPPRSLKSICTSVAFVAWSLGHDPSKRFACVSHSQELASTFARQFRIVVNSDWYRRVFPNVRWYKDTDTECVTTKGGGRFAVSTGGSFTGRGADIIIIDDPLKAEDGDSEVARRAVNDWYGTTLLSRLDDKQRGSIILVVQRLHEDDLAGKLLRDGGWFNLNLPAIAEQDEKIATGPRTFHIRKMGDVLHPAHESLSELKNTERGMGSLKFSAQYQQQPVPNEGNLIKRAWIKTYDSAPSREPGTQIVQSWDIASTTADTGDWSVCTTWLMKNRTYFLLDVWRGRLEFPELRRKLIALAREHVPNWRLIEKAGPGLHLVQEFRAHPVSGVPMPIGIKPEGDKRVRMEVHAARFAAGQVYFPSNALWLSPLYHELLAFPYSRYDDQIDSISQFLTWAEGNYRPPDMICPPIIIRG